MELSVVTSLYHSEKTLVQFCERIVATINTLKVTNFEIILVDDKSPDDSLNVALNLKRRFPQIKVIEFSRNFGHHKALHAGIQNSRGEYIFLIDSDLEEAPENLELFYTRIKADTEVDVYYGVQKERNQPVLRKIFSNLFYTIFLKLISVPYPKNVLTVRIMTRRYINALLQFEEKHLELFALFVLTGFEQKPMLIDKEYKGSTTYSFRKLMAMALDSITTLTNKPLIITLWLGITLIVIGVLFFAMRSYMPEISTWLFVGIAVTFGIIAISLFGIYVSKLLIETKNRPSYIIKKIHD